MPRSIDIRMPPTNTDEGIVAAGRLRSAYPSVGVVVLSAYLEPAWALRLIEENPEGVGYLLKDRVVDIATLVDALRRVCEGETVVDPTIVSRLLGRKRRHDPACGAHRAGARGARARRGRAVEPRDRGAPVHRGAHRRIRT